MTEQEIEELRSRWEAVLLIWMRDAWAQEIDEVRVSGLRGVREDRWVTAILGPYSEAARVSWERTEAELLDAKDFPGGAQASDAVRRIARRARAIMESNRELLAAALAEAGSNLTTRVVEELAGIDLNSRLSRQAANAIVEAISWGQNQAALASGRRVLRVWRTRQDDVVRELHQEAEGDEAPVGAPFPNGLMFPGDSDGPIEQWINCRCYVEMVPLVLQGPVGSPASVFVNA